jgi:hypothetical protein
MAPTENDPMYANETGLKDLRRIIVASAILLATPFYLFCGTHHVCMYGHMQHPPYSSAHVANDGQRLEVVLR